MRDAVEAGVDGCLIVDLPAEHDSELGPLAREAVGHDSHGHTNPPMPKRLPAVLDRASGFSYYVSPQRGDRGRAGGTMPYWWRDAIGGDSQSRPTPVCGWLRCAAPRSRPQRFALDAEGVWVGSALVEQIANAESPEQGVKDVLSPVWLWSQSGAQARSQ